jgi:hypothetical protein
MCVDIATRAPHSGTFSVAAQLPNAKCQRGFGIFTFREKNIVSSGLVRLGLPKELKN